MRWTVSKPPSVCNGWKPDEIEKGVAAANAVFAHTDSEGVALFSCLIAAGKGKTAKLRASVVTDGFDAMTQALEALQELDIEFQYDGIVIPSSARQEFRNAIDFEAFAPGTWNGLQFERRDVEEIARNFTTLHAYHKVPLKLGHNDEQPFTDGQPALGWVTKAWVDGEGKLMLRAEKVPDLVKRAINEGLYRKVSVELDIDVEHKGKFYRYVLSGVALLGADLPAVNTLADLDHYIGDKSSALAASRKSAFTAISGRKEDEVIQVDEKKIQEMVDKAVKPLADQNATLSTQLTEANDKIAKLTRERDDNTKAQQGEKVKAARAGITTKLEAAVKQQLIQPHQREYFINNMGVNDDAKVLTVDVDAFISSMSGGKKVDMTREEAKGSDRGTQRVFEDVGQELDRLAEEDLANNPKSTYQAAFNRALAANPELGQEWLGRPQ